MLLGLIFFLIAGLSTTVKMFLRWVNDTYYIYSILQRRGGPYTSDYLVFKEFRVFLQALRQFFEFYQAFDR